VSAARREANWRWALVSRELAAADSVTPEVEVLCAVWAACSWEAKLAPDDVAEPAETALEAEAVAAVGSIAAVEALAGTAVPGVKAVVSETSWA
jgi:hypothetical protein